MTNEIGLALKDVNLGIMRVLQKRFGALGVDLTPAQGRIIFCIYEHNGEICQKDLEKLVSRNKSTLSSILDNLEKNGYILRSESDSDSRKKVLKITKKSLNAIKILNDDRSYVNSLISQGITEEEYNTFYRVLKKINENLERI